MLDQRGYLQCLIRHCRQPERVPRRDDGGDTPSINHNRANIQQWSEKILAVPIALGISANGLKQCAIILGLFHQEITRDAFLHKTLNSCLVALMKLLEDILKLRGNCLGQESVLLCLGKV